MLPTHRTLASYCNQYEGKNSGSEGGMGNKATLAEVEEEEGGQDDSIGNGEGKRNKRAYRGIG